MNTKDNNRLARKVFTLASVDSTNEYSKRMLSNTKPAEGTVIVAHEQTAGKGQFGKKWESAQGKNLTFSVVLYPHFLEAAHAHRLNQAVCVALHDFFKSTGIDTRIKWPNDIYHNDSKISGILIENALMKEYLSYSVVGIGINVNQDVFSPEIPNPVSMKKITGKTFEPSGLLHSFISFLDKYYALLKSGSYPAISAEYQSLLYKLHEKRTFATVAENFEGITRGVDESGRLLVEVNGTVRHL